MSLSMSSCESKIIERLLLLLLVVVVVVFVLVVVFVFVFGLLLSMLFSLGKLGLLLLYEELSS